MTRSTLPLYVSILSWTFQLSPTNGLYAAQKRKKKKRKRKKVVGIFIGPLLPLLFYFLHTNEFNATLFFFFFVILVRSRHSVGITIRRTIMLPKFFVIFVRPRHSVGITIRRTLMRPKFFDVLVRSRHSVAIIIRRAPMPPKKKLFEILVRSPVLSALPYDKDLRFLNG